MNAYDITADTTSNILKYFWTPDDSMPEGVGFKLFGLEHIIAITICIIAIAVMCIVFKRRSIAKQNSMLKRISLLLIIGELIKNLVLVVQGYSIKHYLPLHLCDMAIYINALHAFSKSPKRAMILGEISFILNLPGALFALLFPVWHVNPLINFFSLFGFFFHTLIVAYPLLIYADRRIRPTIKHILYPIGFLLIVVPIMYLFNKCFDTNYFFVNSPVAGSPLEVLYNMLGNAWLWGYSALAVIIIAIMGLVGDLLNRVFKRGKNV